MRYSSVVNLQQSMKALTFGLTLVRHGETKYNKEGLLQGQLIDAPLSESGLQQAEAAGCYLKHVLFSNVFVSDMLRARQTAETIMKHNTSCLGLQAVWDPLLKEKVKERVKEFVEKMLQKIGAKHWQDRGVEETSPPVPAETSPVEGTADDGVRGVPVHALVVTHGALMCVALRFFVDELHCSVPPGSSKEHMFSLSPNTGLCRFIITVRKEEHTFKLSGIRCVFVHRGDHVLQ